VISLEEANLIMYQTVLMTNVSDLMLHNSITLYKTLPSDSGNLFLRASLCAASCQLQFRKTLELSNLHLALSDRSEGGCCVGRKSVGQEL